MNIKKTLLSVTILLIIAGAFAQTSGKKFQQRIQWQDDENAFEYKVELRGPDGNSEYIETDEAFINISKPAGKYHWRVFVYDYLGRESSVSGWQVLDIKKAVQPKVAEAKTNIDIPVKIDTEGNTVVSRNVEIPVKVESVSPKSKIELVNTKTSQVVPGRIRLDVDSAGQTVSDTATVVVDNVQEGSYKLRVTNPGGLTSESSQPIEIVKQDEAPLRAAWEKAKAEEEARLARAEFERMEAERLAREEAERLAAEEAARIEAERLAAEAAARLEAERIAAEQAAKLAAEEAARAAAEETARLAAEEAARLAAAAAAEEAARIAAEEAAALEAARLAAEEAARLEAEEFERLLAEQKIQNDLAAKSQEEIQEELTKNSFENEVVAKDESGKSVKTKVVAYAAFDFLQIPKGMSMSDYKTVTTVVRPRKGKGANLMLKGTNMKWDREGFISTKVNPGHSIETVAAHRSYYNTMVLQVPVQSTVRIRYSGISATPAQGTFILVLDANKDVVLATTEHPDMDTIRVFQIEKLPPGRYTLAMQYARVHNVICSTQENDFTLDEMQAQWQEYLAQHRPAFLDSTKYINERNYFISSGKKAIEGEVVKEKIDIFSLSPEEAVKILRKEKHNFKTDIIDTANELLAKEYTGYAYIDPGKRVNGMSRYTPRYRNACSWYSGFMELEKGTGVQMMVSGSRWRSNGSGIETISKWEKNPEEVIYSLDNYFYIKIAAKSDAVIHVAKDVQEIAKYSWISLVDTNDYSRKATLVLKNGRERREFILKGLEPGVHMFACNGISIESLVLSLSYSDREDFSMIKPVQDAIDRKAEIKSIELKKGPESHLTVALGLGATVGTESFYNSYVDNTSVGALNGGITYERQLKNLRRISPQVGIDFGATAFTITSSMQHTDLFVFDGFVNMGLSYALIKNRVFLGAKGGAGVMAFNHNYSVDMKADSVSTNIYPGFDAGAFLKGRIVMGVTAEAGARMKYAVGVNYHLYEPYFSLGWRF